ncbi:hypothetical protein GCM10027514_25800 [Azotobacter armeniacus]
MVWPRFGRGCAYGTERSSLHFSDAATGSGNPGAPAKDAAPLDDCLHALQWATPTPPPLSPHRFFKRHGVSQLPCLPEPGRERNPFKRYPLGYYTSMILLHTLPQQAQWYCQPVNC